MVSTDRPRLLIYINKLITHMACSIPIPGRRGARHQRTRRRWDCGYGPWLTSGWFDADSAHSTWSQEQP